MKFQKLKKYISIKTSVLKNKNNTRSTRQIKM